MAVSGVAESLYAAITLLNLKGSLLARQEKYIESNDIYLQMKQSLERFFLSTKDESYLSSSFVNNIYQTVLVQIFFNYYDLKDYKEAAKYLNTGLNFAIEKNSSHNLDHFIECKAKLLALEGNLTEATEYLTTAKVLYRLKGLDDYANKLTLPEPLSEFNTYRTCHWQLP